MTAIPPGHARFVACGSDRFGEERGLGITSLHYKVASEDTGNRLFVIEQTMLSRGGPPRHLHLEQEEFFYSIEGNFIAEVGEDRFSLNPGDSLLAPRRVPHTWAYIGDQVGRILIAFSPAGRMESFFRETTKANAMPPEDPEFWAAYGMELVGPPLAIG